MARRHQDAMEQVQIQRAGNVWRQRRIDALTTGRSGPPSTPKAAPSVSVPAPTAPTVRRPAHADLERNVYDRSAGAHLDELALVAAVVNPAAVHGGVMVDVGAHHGSAFAPFRQAGWKIHAFEPDPRHAAMLAERHGDDPLVVLDRRAVSNSTGDHVTFYASAESAGISGLSAFRDSHVAIGDVETVALRDVSGIDRVDLLKIDTEGYERFVLEGFPWDRLHPETIVAEFEDSKTVRLGYTTADLIATLRGRGYQVWVSEWHPIVRYGIRHQWRRLVESDRGRPDPAGWGNLIGFLRPVTAADMGRALSDVLTLGHPVPA